MGHGSFFGGMFFPFGWIGLLLIIIGGVMLYRLIANKHTNPKNALEILDLKYVSGEIDEETYRHKKKVLNGKERI